MDSRQLKERINNLSIWKKGDQRAPHKPLLILYALAQLQNKGSRFLRYEEVREPLTNLLKEFGPRRHSYHPEEPFVRLTRDGIWTLSLSTDSIHINNPWLLKHDISGGFDKKVYELLLNNPSLIREVANMVLYSHFPDSIHEDILAAVGLDLDSRIIDFEGCNSKSTKCRDPKFREKILRAYEYSCAICGFNVRLGNNLVAIEAAHIKWHQAGGPDSEQNGIALCAMHHKLFDLGVFTIKNSKELMVAEDAYGTSGFEEWLMRYHGQPVRSPIHPDYQPNASYVNWHVKEVFKGPERYGVGEIPRPSNSQNDRT